MLFITTLILAVCLTSCQQKIPTQADLDAAKDTINEIINDNADGNEHPFIAGFVRLAFHDCVGPGHCDGCVNHTIHDNKGLKTYTDKLDEAYPTHSTNMSRVDFYIFAAYVALERATALDAVTDKFQGMSDFKVGREDCGLYHLTGMYFLWVRLILALCNTWGTHSGKNKSGKFRI